MISSISVHKKMIRKRMVSNYGSNTSSKKLEECHQRLSQLQISNCDNELKTLAEKATLLEIQVESLETSQFEAEK